MLSILGGGKLFPKAFCFHPNFWDLGPRKTEGSEQLLPLRNQPEVSGLIECTPEAKAWILIVWGAQERSCWFEFHPLGQTTYLLWKLRWMISPLWASVCSSGPSGQAELGRAFQLWYPFWLKILKKNVHWAPPTCQTPSRLWGTMGSCHYGAYILAPMYCEFLRAYEEYTLYFELVYLRKRDGAGAPQDRM